LQRLSATLALTFPANSRILSWQPRIRAYHEAAVALAAELTGNWRLHGAGVSDEVMEDIVWVYCFGLRLPLYCALDSAEAAAEAAADAAERRVRTLQMVTQDSVVLEDEHNPDYEPADEEVLEYATFLGMDMETDQDLLWIAREGLTAPLPAPWKPCKTENNEIYYFNFESGESVWGHPCDTHYKMLFDSKKLERK
jgi:hypothetical protein